jgi:hypothetical protein
MTPLNNINIISAVTSLSNAMWLLNCLIRYHSLSLNYQRMPALVMHSPSKHHHCLNKTLHIYIYRFISNTIQFHFLFIYFVFNYLSSKRLKKEEEEARRRKKKRGYPYYLSCIYMYYTRVVRYHPIIFDITSDSTSIVWILCSSNRKFGNYIYKNILYMSKVI